MEYIQCLQKVNKFNKLTKILKQRMHLFNQENQQQGNRFTLSFNNGFVQSRKKSLGAIPFRRLKLEKANTTQTTQTVSRGNSYSRPSQKVRENQQFDTIVKKNQKDIALKSSFFDCFLSDINILKDFKLMSHIGKGCFSTVTLAIHKQTHKCFAIKTYQKTQSLQWYRLQSIKREIRHLKKLQHENVIELFHVFKDKKKVLLLMDNGGKQSLSGLLRKTTKFTEQQAKFYFKQVLKAISYCHSRGVSHRDIKPENILVDDEGNVKIIDFGFSAATNTKLTTYCGTPPFMSPQITKKTPYGGAEADVWALGVMLYLLVVGTLPFRATNEPELYRLIQQGKYPIKQTMSKSLKNILNRMLNCDASKRASAQSILSDPWFQQK